MTLTEYRAEEMESYVGVEFLTFQLTLTVYRTGWRSIRKSIALLPQPMYYVEAQLNSPQMTLTEYAHVFYIYIQKLKQKLKA